MRNLLPLSLVLIPTLALGNGPASGFSPTTSDLSATGNAESTADLSCDARTDASWIDDFDPWTASGRSISESAVEYLGGSAAAEDAIAAMKRAIDTIYSDDGPRRDAGDNRPLAWEDFAVAGEYMSDTLWQDLGAQVESRGVDAISGLFPQASMADTTWQSFGDGCPAYMVDTLELGWYNDAPRMTSAVDATWQGVNADGEAVKITSRYVIVASFTMSNGEVEMSEIRWFSASGPEEPASPDHEKAFDINEMMGGFTLLTFGDANLGEGSLYGSAAVLGDLHTQNSNLTTISNAMSAPWPYSGARPVIDGVSTLLMIGGRFVGGEGRQDVVWGGVRIGDVSNLTVEENGDFQLYQLRPAEAPASELNVGYDYLSGVMDSTSLDRVQIDDAASLVAEKDEFIAVSEFLRSDEMLDADNVAILEPAVRVTLEPGKINVLNVDADSEFVSLETDPSADTPLVINVNVGDAATVTLPTSPLDDRENNAYVLLNLYSDEPREVQVDRLYGGTLLAPQLTLELSETTRHDGLIIADGVSGLGFVHSHISLFADLTPLSADEGDAGGTTDNGDSEDQAPTAGDEGAPVWLWIMIAVGALALATVVAVLVLRARRSGGAGRGEGTP